MKEERKISIAIPTFCRFQQTIDSFKQVLDDERVSEFCISDDFSQDDSCPRLVELSKTNNKIKVYRNSKNLDCYRNKRIAAGYVTNKFLGLWDSDNVFDKSYIDALYAIPKWDAETIYQPSYARPHFDFRQWEGLTLTGHNVAQYIDTHLMTALNAMNSFMNKETYMDIWDGTVNAGSSDSIYVSYLWLKNGGKIYITPNLSYEHFISEKNDGHYQTQSHKYVDFHKSLMEKIKQLH